MRRGILEEIVPQHARDAEQQVGVDVAIVKDLVGIGPVAMDGLGKPSNGTPLGLQLVPNQIAKMNACHDC